MAIFFLALFPVAFLMRLPGLPSAKPADVGLDAGTLDEHRKWADIHLRRHVYPGKVECIVKDNKLVYSDVIGYSDAERKVLMTEHTLFRGFSMTKSITGVAALILADEGSLKIQDPVGKYIPSWNNAVAVRPAYSDDPKVKGSDLEKVEPLQRSVTIGHLLMHTSGVGYGPMKPGPSSEKKARAQGLTEKVYKKLSARCDNGEITSLAEFVDELAKIPLRFQPGKQCLYGYGVDVVGRVIEVVSGKPLETFLQERVFKPLGFKDTTFFAQRRNATKVASMYSVVRPLPSGAAARGTYRLVRVDGKTPLDSAWVEGSRTRQGTPAMGGGFWGFGKGGLLFSCHDLALFLNMLVNGGKTRSGKQLLKPSTANSLQTDWLPKKFVSVRSSRRKLKGWDDANCQHLGWSPVGHVQLRDSPHIGANFMGGTGYWWADRKRKLFGICLHEAFWDTNISKWDEERDDLDKVIKQAVAIQEEAGRKKRRLA